MVSKCGHLRTGLTGNVASKGEAHCLAHPCSCLPPCGSLRRGQVAEGRDDACLFYLLTCPSASFTSRPLGPWQVVMHLFHDALQSIPLPSPSPSSTAHPPPFPCYPCTWQVVMHLFRDALQSIPLLRGLDPHFITALVTRLKLEYFSPGEL